MGVMAINKQDPVAALGFVSSELVKVFHPLSSDFSIGPTLLGVSEPKVSVIIIVTADTDCGGMQIFVKTLRQDHHP
jgi:hypothetical protein